GYPQALQERLQPRPMSRRLTCPERFDSDETSIRENGSGPGGRCTRRRYRQRAGAPRRAWQ
ncbi:hypothetical protein, partial [Xanthomonas graminis]